MTMRLPKPDLLKLISGIRTDLDTLKTTGQHLDGDSLRGYLTDSGLGYDYHFVLPAAPSNGISVANYLLTFTNSHAEHGAIITGFFNYAANATDANNRNYVPAWSNGYYMVYQKTAITDTYTQWSFMFSQTGAYNEDIYVKWSFTGTDAGTVTFTSN